MSESQIKTEINLLELMRHSDDINAAFAALLFPCAHCGDKPKADGHSSGGGIYLHCSCGIWVSGGMLEVLAAWNRRDGKEFNLDSEYAQRLVASESKAASFRTDAFREIKRLQARTAELERELAQKNQGKVVSEEEA